MMELDFIKIKCPNCGSVLQVKKQPGLDSKSITCPVCKTRSPFMEFGNINNRQTEETEYPGKRKYSEPGTQYNSGKNQVIGRLIAVSAGCTYQLRPGRNVVGRKAQASTADFQIPMGDKKRMSREHLIIEVTNDPVKGYVHCVKLYKEKVNPTFVGNERLEYGDCLILKKGDLIRLPDVDVRFELLDSDDTEY